MATLIKDKAGAYSINAGNLPTPGPDFYMDPNGPQYSPAGGIGTVAPGLDNNQYTYQPTGWERNMASLNTQETGNPGGGSVGGGGSAGGDGGGSSSYSSPFMQATADMIKYAQGGISDISKNYADANQKLMNAQQYAQDRAWRASSDVLGNKELDPRNFVSLASSAGEAYKPSILSPERQMSTLADQYNAQNRIYENMTSAAQKAQDQELQRQQLAETKRSNLADEGIKRKTADTTVGGYTAQELRKLRNQGIDPSDITAADKFLYSSSASEPYSPDKMNQLRQAGIDPYDTVAADEFLYGTKETTPIPKESYKDIARALVKNYSSLVSGYNYAGNDPIEKAINFINEVGELDINDKNVKLSKAQKQAIIDSINSEYSGGRTFMQRLMPWGK